MSADYSRPLRLAGVISAEKQANLRERLSLAVTQVTVEPSQPQSLLCARVLLTCLRRLPGTIALDPSGLGTADLEALELAVANVNPDCPLQIRKSSDNALRAHIGMMSPSPAIRLVPDGYGGHVARSLSATFAVSQPANPLGAIYTAALGAAELFKDLVSARPRRRFDHGHLQFCPVTLTDRPNCAPPMPVIRSLDLGIVGIGAIGTGIALALSELPLDGRILLVDPQVYAGENLATYSLGGAADVLAARPKTAVAAAALSNFDTRRFDGTASALMQAIDAKQEQLPQIIHSGVDSRDARHETQRLWPERIVDAGTSDTMLGISDILVEDGPCLICLYPTPTGGTSSEELLARETGLSLERCQRGADLLTAEDLAELPAEGGRRLQPFIGRPVCGLLTALGLSLLHVDDFQPAVSFVSLQAACLSVGRLIAIRLGIPDLPNLIQYDSLIGPQNATQEKRKRTPSCYCQQRAATISRLRQERYA